MRFAVLASGNGTNLQAIIDAVKKGEIAAELALVDAAVTASGGLVGRLCRLLELHS